MSARLAALLPGRRQLLAAAATAVLLFLAYAPYNIPLLAFVALVPYLWVLDGPAAPGPEPRRVLHAYWVGVVVNGVVLYWMVIALWHFTPLSLAGYLASVFIVLAPQYALVAWLKARIRRGIHVRLWLVFPLAWTAVEWIGAHLGDVRFPWLGLGTAVGSTRLLAQWADLAGARGLTLWAAWVNVAVYLAVRRWIAGERPRAWRWAGVVAATFVLAAGYGLWRERTLVMRPVTRVLAIQPNFGFDEKRNTRDSDTLLRVMLRLTREAHAAHPDARLIVWSEAVLNVYFLNHPHWEAAVGDLARELRTPIVAGALDADLPASGGYIGYNAAFLFDSTGSDRAQPSYRKTYLVPIVERVPFVNPAWFGDLKYFGGFGRGDRFPVYRVSDGGFGILICYESAFEDLSRRYRRDGADFIVNITNDSWYGTTAAPYQHASHLIVRAIETRVGIARAAQTGISEVVDPLGREHGRTRLNTEAVVAETVLTTDVVTLYVRLGDWVAALSLAGTAALLLAALLRNRSKGV